MIMELTTEQKLDALAEYHSQKDSIEAKKRALLNEVKTPDEVIDIQRNAAEAIEYQQKATTDLIALLSSRRDAALDTVQIPPEIRAALAEIDRKRAEIRAEYDEKILKVQRDNSTYRAEVNRETEAKTHQVFEDLARRKADIEAEFTGDQAAVDANIAKLEAEIKADAKTCGKTIKGKYFMAIYVKGRVSWNTDMLDGMIALVPQLEKARKEGEPSITLRKI